MTPQESAALMSCNVRQLSLQDPLLLLQTTARRIGLDDSNHFVGAMTEYHMRRHHISEEHYAVYMFRSKRHMRRKMVRRFGLPTSWHMFEVEWVKWIAQTLMGSF